MKKILAALILFSVASDVLATNFNSITIQGELSSPTPIFPVRVWIRSGGPSGAVVGTASDVALIPDAGGFFSTQTYVVNPGPWVFQTGSDYIVQLTSSTDEIISTFPVTAVPFALTVRGDAQTGNQNVFGAYGNIGVGTTAPSYRLHITSAAGTGGDMVVISTGTSNVIRLTGGGEVYASKYYGDGSSLTGVMGAGDNLGNHTAAQSLNMAGNNLLNVSTIVVQGDSIVISPNSQGNYDHSISIGPDTVNNNGYGIGIGNNASSNWTNGIGLGYGAVSNFDGGVGIGKGTSYNYTLGVGVGTYAANNQNEGVGIGFSSSGNNYYGVGIGADAHSNSNYGVGIGADAHGNSYYGVGIGNGAYNNHSYAVGIGAGSHDNAYYATSIGANTLSLSSSVALGSDAKATNSESLAIGAGARATALHSVALGAYTVNNTTSSVKIREGYLLLVDSITASGLITANKFSGDGSGLTGITPLGAVLKTGDTMTGQLTIAGSTLTVTGKDANGYSLSLSSGINMPAGTVTAGLFNGSGASLTALNASNLASGTVADGRLSSNVNLLEANQTVGGNKTFTGFVVLPTRDKLSFLNELANSSSTVIDNNSPNQDYVFTNTTFMGNTCVLGSTLTIITNGGRVQATFSGALNASGSLLISLGLKTDGVPWNGDYAITTISPGGAWWNTGASFSVITLPLPAGTHSFCLDTKIASGTGQLLADRAGIMPQFWVQELR